MKLLLADDHTLFRDALVQYITRAQPETHIAVAKDFSEVSEAMKVDPKQDLILLDLKMPGMNGMEGLKTLRAEYPNIPVALMSGVAEPHDVRTAMNIGAAGYFPKTLSGKAMLDAVKRVLAGKKFLPVENKNNAIMSSYYEDPQAASTNQAGDGLNLTPREKEVLGFLARGVSNKEIAIALGVQLVTVKLHVRGVCRKLKAKNRTQAALKAREMGITS
jgi:two-component system nitrate/nitrite response regulator NarL